MPGVSLYRSDETRHRRALGDPARETLAADIEAGCDDDRGENARQHRTARGQPMREPRPGQAAGEAADDEQAGDPPVDQAEDGIARRRGQRRRR